MGIEHVINDLDASELNIGYSPLVPEGLEYLNFFGGSISPGRNLAPGKSQAAVVGNPTAGSMTSGILLTPLSSFIQTAVAHSAQMTFLTIGRTVGNGQHVGVSNFGTGVGNVGVSSRMPVSGGNATSDLTVAYVSSAGAPTTSSRTTSASPVSNEAVAFAGRHNMTTSGALATQSDLLSKGLSAKSSGPLPAGASWTPGSALRVGSGYANLGIAWSVLFAAIWSRVLTDDELQKQYQQVRDFYATKGVSI